MDKYEYSRDEFKNYLRINFDEDNDDEKNKKDDKKDKKEAEEQ